MTAAKCAGAAVGQVVAVHRGDDDVLQPEPGHGVGDAERFVGVERAGQAGAHVAEAQARVQVSPMIIMVAWRCAPALADVGAGGFLADRDQAVLAHQARGSRDRPGGWAP